MVKEDDLYISQTPHNLGYLQYKPVIKLPVF